MSENKDPRNNLSSPSSNEESMFGNDSYASGSASVHPSPEEGAKSIPGHQSLGPETPATHPPVGSDTPEQQGPTNSSGFSTEPPIPMTVMPATAGTSATPASATIITVLVRSDPLGEEPLRMECPACHRQIVTITERTFHPMAHIMCVSLCVCCCCLCAWIPYILPAFRVIRHVCPKCMAILGYYNP